MFGQLTQLPYTVGFLLIPNFSMMAFAAAIEPLRSANRMSGRNLYHWRLYSRDGAAVRASNGLEITPHAAIAETERPPMVVVCAGLGDEQFEDRAVFAWLRRLASEGSDVGSLSTGAYVNKVEEARAALHDETPINFVASWHRHPQLIQAILDNIQAGLQLFPADVRPRVPILFTAHSLPSRVLDMNDPYPLEVQGTVDALRERLGTLPTRFAYQSQGRSQEPWLGPSVEQAVDELAQEGYRELLVAPIGFLCDHIETLFDVDIELKESAARKGQRLERIPMLNDSAPLIDVLASVVDMHETLVAH